MTNEVIVVLYSLLLNFWRFFNSWYIPGTHVTPAALFLLLLVVPIVVRFVKRILSDSASEVDKLSSKKSDKGGNK